jgi:hypothetical protein
VFGIVFTQPGYGWWTNVKPEIQTIKGLDPDAEPLHLSNPLKIRYLSGGGTSAEDLEIAWCAEELATRLRKVAEDHQVPLAVTVERWGCLPPPEENDIVLGLWNPYMRPVFDTDSWEPWHHSPMDKYHPEGYYILVPDVISPVYLTASTTQGLRYGVTSLWKAVDVAGTEFELGVARIEDFPTFEFRGLSVFSDLGDPDPTLVPKADSNHPGINRPEAFADSVTKIAYYAMLENKANSLVHNGSPWYYGNNNSHRPAESTFLTRFGTGLWGTDSHKKWKEFGIDWYEGVNWLDQNANQDNYYRSIQIVDTCSVEQDGGWVRLHVSSGTTAFTGGDFQGWGTQPNPPGWDPPASFEKVVEANQNIFLRVKDIQSSGGGATFTAAKQKLQNHWGLEEDAQHVWTAYPSRQMILSFKVRVNSMLENDIATIKVNMPGVPDGRLAGDYPPTDDGGYLPTNPCTGYHTNFDLVQSGQSLGRVAPTDGWVTLKQVFTTYGAKYITVEVTPTGVSDNATVDFDDFKIVDSDFYQLYAPEHQNMSFEVLRDGISQFTFNTGYDLQELSNSTKAWKVHHAAVSVPTAAWNGHDGFNANDKVVVTYRSFARRAAGPIVETGNVTGEVYPIIDGGSPRYLARTDHLTSFGGDAALEDQRDWFESNFSGNVRGYYSAENEIHGAGWRDGDYGDMNQSFAQTYGEFMSDVAGTLSPNKPLILFSDMFSPHLEAKRFCRTNNPLGIVGGLYHGDRDNCMSSSNIPGLDPDATIWFINEDIDYVSMNQAEIDARQEWWNGVVSRPDNKWSELLGGHLIMTRDGTPVPWPNDNNRAYYKHVVNGAYAARESGARIPGGMRFFWPGEFKHGDYATTEYYGANSGRTQQWLQWLWNCGTVTIGIRDFADYYDHTQNTAHADFKIYPQEPGPAEIASDIDSVVLQYRFGLSGDWLRIKQLGNKYQSKSDSVYSFDISLPDSGGVVEYRVWAFDDFGRYHSYPASGTKLKDPDVGDRLYFTFERRKDGVIDHSMTFHTPGVMTQPYVIKPGATLAIRPLPDYVYSTMAVSDNASISFEEGLETVVPQLDISAGDTATIAFELQQGSSHWDGIDSRHGLISTHNVKFLRGTDGLSISPASGIQSHSMQKTTFEDIVHVSGGSVKVEGSPTFSSLIVDSGATLELQPGTVVSFADTARLLVSPYGKLHCIGTDSLPIVFTSTADSLKWLGVQISKHAADTSSFAYCQFVNSQAGLLADNGVVSLKHCSFAGNHTGVMAINGGTVLADSCTLTSNQDGVVIANLATGHLSNCAVSRNSGPGLVGLSRSTYYLENCVVDSNSGDGTAGGLGLYTGSQAFLKCTNVEGNTGPGITAYGGAVMMSSVDTVAAPNVNWRGNSIRANHTVGREGQLTLMGRIGLGLYNGHNQIADSAGTSTLVRWEDHPTRDWWRDVYWGRTDTANILNRLPSSVLLSRVDSSWSNCPAFRGDATEPDSLITDFLAPHNSEAVPDWSSARTAYRNLVKLSPKSDYAFAAADRLLDVDRAAHYSVDSTRLYLSSIADTTTNAALKRWLKNTIGWCWAEKDSIAKANSLYDSLATYGATRLDRASASAQKQMVAVHKLSSDTAGFTALSVIQHTDSARMFMERMNLWTQTVITDSVIMYAPCQVDTMIEIAQGGTLVILPHPGTEEAVVNFGPHGSITVDGFSESQPRGKLYVLGTAQSQVIMNWDTVSTGGPNIASTCGYVEMKHAVLQGSGWVNSNENPLETTTRMPIFQADSCTFKIFADGIICYGTDSSSYLTNSTLQRMGGVDMFGAGSSSALALFGDAHLRIENCHIEGSREAGLLNYYSNADLNVIGTTITGSDGNGILNWEGGNLTLECSQVTDNGDTLAEIWVNGGTVDLVGAHTQLADSSGTLIYSSDPSYVDVGDGENSFDLWTGNGRYLASGATSGSWSIGMNTWAPYTPGDTAFYAHLCPASPSFWSVDTSLATFASCEASTQSIGDGLSGMLPGTSDKHQTDTWTPGSGNPATTISALQPTIGLTATTTVAGGALAKGPVRSAQKGLSAVNEKRSNQAMMLNHYREELSQWRTAKALRNAGDKQASLQRTMTFLADHPGSKLVPAALANLAGLAQKGDLNGTVSKFLAEQSNTLTDPAQRIQAKRFSYVAKAREGNPSEALAGLEEMMETAPTLKDSLEALVDAMGIGFFNRHNKSVHPRSPQIRCANVKELQRRVIECARLLDNPAMSAKGHGPMIPTQYALYQNYPNPFNPNTEIRFDVPEAVRVEMKVFNILGQEVAKLIDEVRPAGAYRLTWDSRTTSGASVASGLYIYRIKAGNFVDAKKMMLVR